MITKGGGIEIRRWNGSQKVSFKSVILVSLKLIFDGRAKCLEFWTL